MDQQQAIIFEDAQEQIIFDYLTTNIHFNPKDYDEKDLDIDIVFKMEVPSQAYIRKEDTAKFSELFQNIPYSYEKVYQVIQDYIYFLTENDDQIISSNNLITRNLTSFQYLHKTQSNFHNIMFKEKDESEELLIECAQEYIDEIDTFTLQYNMIVIILQNICGFNVKTYLFDEEQKDGSIKKQVYFLISQNIQNLMKLANKYSIQKQVDMTQIDFCINDPVDSSGRPLKYNSKFSNHQQGNNQYRRRQMTNSRLLKLKKVNLEQQIINQSMLKDWQVIHFEKYCQEVSIEIDRVFKDKQMLITPAQKRYIFTHNRNKINQGCYLLLQEMKKKALVFDAIIRLNKKYNYPSYQYGESFFPFRLLSKDRPFFQKLKHILTYKSVIDSPYGDLSLFNRMEKIKLTYLCLGEYFKMQNLKKIGVQIFAINNDFQKFGQITFECENQEGKGESIGGGLNGKTLAKEWHMFIPFTSSIRTIRDYLGQKCAFQIMLKINLIKFFTCLLPFSIGSDIILMYFFEGTNSTYIFSLCEITFIVISLTIFIVAWKIEQQQFFNNYYQKDINNSIREEYQGPFYRHCITDKPNHFEYQKNFKNRSINLLSYLGMTVLLICEGVYFYGIRMLIVKNCQALPSTSSAYIRVPHFIFYGIFFISNYIFQEKIVYPSIIKIVGLHNYPEKTQHQSQVRLFSYIFTFGIELLGPLFFTIIQPFNRTSCYAAECIDEFLNYIYSRFAIIFLFISFRLFYIICYYFYGVMTSQKKIFQDGVKYKTYHDKLNCLLRFVRIQYQKTQISFDLNDQAKSLYYVCIFSIVFPYCSVLALGMLYLEYILKRIKILRVGRRPIPKRQDLIRVGSLLQNILHLCIIVNSWTICYSYEFLEYDFSAELQIFIPDITLDSILTFKIIVSAVLMIFLQMISLILKSLMNRLINLELQNRKLNKYKKYLFNTESKPPERDSNKDGLIPLKTIFRTFVMDGLARYKSNQINFRKMYIQSKMKKQKNKVGKKEDNKLQERSSKHSRYTRHQQQMSNLAFSNKRDTTQQSFM